MPDTTAKPVFCDAVRTIGLHNGVVRIAFVRLDQNGKAIPCTELLIPAALIPTLVKTLQQVRV